MDNNKIKRAQAETLLSLWNDLDKLKWWSTYADWNMAVTQIRKEIYDRIATLGYGIEVSDDQPGFLIT